MNSEHNLDNLFEQARRDAERLRFGQDELASILDKADSVRGAPMPAPNSRIQRLFNRKTIMKTSLLTTVAIVTALLWNNGEQPPIQQSITQVPSQQLIQPTQPTASAIQHGSQHQRHDRNGTAQRPTIQTTTPLNSVAPVDSVKEPAPYDFVAVDDGGEPNTDMNRLSEIAIYPPEARQKGIEGNVMVRVLVGKNGKAKRCFVEQTASPLLNQAAMDAVLQAPFTAAIHNKQPVDCWVSYPVKFKLNEISKGGTIGGVLLLKLNDEELQTLGVSTSQSSGENTTTLITGKDTTVFNHHPRSLSFLIRSDKEAKRASVRMYYKRVQGGTNLQVIEDGFVFTLDEKSSEKIPDIVPVLLSQGINGQKISVYDGVDTVVVSKTVNHLVPVAVAINTKAEQAVVLWYEPTPAVLAALPERYRTALERELKASEKYSSLCDIQNPQERKEIENAIAGRPFFDTWRSCAGVLSVKSVFPNPAREQSTVRFRLDAPRNITLSVHDIYGQRLSSIPRTNELPSGEHELLLDLTGRTAGIYLVVLTTDNGEQAVQRIIVER